jgi:transposase
MIDKRTLFEIYRLKDLSLTERKIARQLGISRPTVRKYLASPDLTAKQRTPKAKKLAPYTDYISELLNQWPNASAVVVKQRLADRGYPGGITILRDYLRTLKSQKQSPAKFIRFETSAGCQCQCDWGHFGSLSYGNTTRKLYAMAVTECHSRMLYVEFTHSQTQAAFLRTLLNAFIFFGGTPKELVHDNLKTAVIERVGGIIRFNEEYLHFLRPLHIVPYACGINQPHQKGKIEKGGIHYLRYNFWPCRTFVDLDDVNAQATQWRDQVANCRLHSTTGEAPIVRFQLQSLNPLPEVLPDLRDRAEVHLQRDCHFKFDGNSYSAPHWLVGKVLNIQADHHTVVASYRTKIVAQHARSWQRKTVIDQPEHYQDLLRHRKKAHLTKQQELFLSLGPEAATWLAGLAQRQKNLSRAISRILELRQSYGTAAIIDALQLATQYRAFDISYVENILYQRNRPRPAQGRVQLKDPSLNELDLADPDLLLYDAIALKKRSDHHDPA